MITQSIWRHTQWRGNRVVTYWSFMVQSKYVGVGKDTRRGRAEVIESYCGKGRMWQGGESGMVSLVTAVAFHHDTSCLRSGNKKSPRSEHWLSLCHQCGLCNKDKKVFLLQNSYS